MESVLRTLGSEALQELLEDCNRRGAALTDREHELARAVEAVLFQRRTFAGDMARTPLSIEATWQLSCVAREWLAANADSLTEPHVRAALEELDAILKERRRLGPATRDKAQL